MRNFDANYFLSGQNIYLREVQITDVTYSYYQWMNDHQITQSIESRFYPNSGE